MYDTSDIRKGLKIMLDGSPYTVVEFQFVKPGKGAAFTRTKMKNLLSGGVIERNLRSGDKLEPANVETKTMQYLYQEGDTYVFMDTTTYDQVNIVAETVADLFGGAIEPFLAGGTTIFGSITELLDEQWARLSSLEQTVLYWLVIVREPVTLDDLLAVLVAPLAHVQVLEAVDGLRRRSLIERGAACRQLHLAVGRAGVRDHEAGRHGQ